MSDNSKNIWKQSIASPRGVLLAWLGLMIANLIIFLLIMLAMSMTTGFRWSSEEFELLWALDLVVTAVFILVLFIRWIFHWRNFKRSLFFLACVATLIGLFYAEEDWRGRHDWEQFKRAEAAKGETLDWESAIPAPVPDNQNFALTPVIASSYEMYFDKNGHEVRPRNTNVVDRFNMVVAWRDNPWAHLPNEGRAYSDWQAARKTDLTVWQEYFRSPPPPASHQTNAFPTAPQPQSPAADVLLALSKYDSVIEEIREAAKLPYSRFPLTYGTGEPETILLPHLAGLSSCNRVLGLRALAELQTGRSGNALADVELQLRLVDATRTEPVLISHMIRADSLRTALQPVWEGLAAHQWSDEQLAELDAALAKLDFLADWGIVVRGQRGLDIELLNCIPQDLSDMSQEQGNRSPLSVGILSWLPSGWIYQNELRVCWFYDRWCLPVMDVEGKTISPAKVRAADEAENWERSRRNPEFLLERLILPALGGQWLASAQVSTDLARTAIALERYRLANGEYPAALDALAPRFIAQVPHDIIGGAPLHYRRTDDGQFVLYSVGWNEKDDGGVVALKKGAESGIDLDRGDWVWRYPAK
jgi:hypothetical protein